VEVAGTFLILDAMRREKDVGNSAADSPLGLMLDLHSREVPFAWSGQFSFSFMML
jgi:hypothetical protein